MEELNQVADTPQVINQGVSELPEDGLKQEIPKNEVTREIPEPLAKKNSLS